ATQPVCTRLSCILEVSGLAKLSLFFTCSPTTMILTLSLHDALPISLKGSSSTEELHVAKKAIQLLGGEFKEEHQFALPIEESERAIIITNKVKNTPKKYPRKPGLPAKQPLS